MNTDLIPENFLCIFCEYFVSGLHYPLTPDVAKKTVYRCRMSARDHLGQPCTVVAASGPEKETWTTVYLKYVTKNAT